MINLDIKQINFSLILHTSPKSKIFSHYANTLIVKEFMSTTFSYMKP